MSVLSSLPSTHPALGPITNQAVLLTGVDWTAYETIVEALRDRPRLQITYDRGRLEIMTLSLEHERIKKILSRLIDTLSEELNVRMSCCGSTTFKHVEFDRALEPDECYYIKNVDRIRGLLSIDLHRYPPPDFVIEVDATNRSIDRLPIYGRLGVPELWRWENGVIHILQLSETGEYLVKDSSSLFISNFDVAELLPFVRIGLDDNDTTMIRSFRKWLKQYLADRGLAS